MDQVGIPVRHRTATPDAVRGDKDWLMGALEHPEKWLGIGAGYYMVGPYSAGKSSAAAVLTMDATRRMEKCLWVSMRDIPPMMFEETERGIQSKRILYNADLLVIDDLGAERFRLESAAGQALEDCVRILYDRRRSVIITSNVAWESFQLTYPDRFVSVVKRVVWPVVMDDLWPEQPGV